MKLYLFGSCSGTEPMPGRHHTAFALEYEDKLYWFDAGEGCSHTAHTMGVDVMKITEIYLSHPHMDHAGGLANLLWTIRKLAIREDRRPVDGRVVVHVPSERMWDGVWNLLCEGGETFSCPYPTEAVRIREGMLTEGPVSVQAMPNRHMGEWVGEPQSFSFRITVGGKRIVYSGDIRKFEELCPLLADGCDLLLMETGHHSPVAFCEWAEAQGTIRDIYFLHHGRHILYGYEEMLTESGRRFSGTVRFANDRDVVELS